MKNKLLIFALLVSLSLTAQTLTGHWELISYVHPVSNEKVDRNTEDYNNGRLTFRFADDSIRGSIKGYTTSNYVGGDYILDKNNSIQITRYGGTRVGEHGWGAGFNIRNVEFFKVSTDSLIIYSIRNKNILRFVRLED